MLVFCAKQLCACCRVYTRDNAHVLGVLSLSLQNCPAASSASLLRETNNPRAPVDGSPGEPNGMQGRVSSFAEAVKEAVALLVPACVAFPMTIAKVTAHVRVSRRGMTAYIAGFLHLSYTCCALVAVCTAVIYCIVAVLVLKCSNQY